MQQMLLNAAKDVASALGALINATKNASGKPVSDPSTEVLKTTGKVCNNTANLTAYVRSFSVPSESERRKDNVRNVYL